MSNNVPKWKNNEISKFLLELRKFPCLYDLSNEEYKKKDERESAFNDLLNNLRKHEEFISLTPEQLKNKKCSLQNTYKQEVQKVRNSKKSGAGTSDIYKPKLEWFAEADCFLKECTSTRNTMNNVRKSISSR